MQTVYINYPNPHINCYANGMSNQIGKQRKDGQRHVRITRASLSEELAKFAEKQYKFGNNPATNDMYIDLDLGDLVFEMAVLEYIQRLIGRYYTPLSPAKLHINKV